METSDDNDIYNSFGNMNISETPGMDKMSPEELMALAHTYDAINSMYENDLSPEDKNKRDSLTSMRLFIFNPDKKRLEKISFTTAINKINRQMQPEYDSIMTYGLYYKPSQLNVGGKRNRKSKRKTRKSKRKTRKSKRKSSRKSSRKYRR